jgi:hypothetical protein
VVIDLGVITATFAVAEYDDTAGTVFWTGRVYPLLSDDIWGIDDFGNKLARFALEANCDPAWTFLGYPPKTQSYSLAPGTTLVHPTLPQAYSLNLSLGLGPPNDWYHTSTIKKLGYLRRINNGYAQDVIWINSLKQAGNFGVGRGDSIEVTLAPGVSGSLQSLPWIGIPPVLTAYGGAGTIVHSSLGWFFAPDNL